MDGTLISECPKDDIISEEKVGETVDIEKDLESNSIKSDDILGDKSSTPAEEIHSVLTENGVNSHNVDLPVDNSETVINDEDIEEVVPTKVETEINEQPGKDIYVVESSSEILPLQEELASGEVIIVANVENEETTDPQTMDTEIHEVIPETTEAIADILEETSANVTPEIIENTSGNFEPILVEHDIQSIQVPNENVEASISDTVETVTSENVDTINHEEVQPKTLESVVTIVNSEKSIEPTNTEPSQLIVRKSLSPGPVPLMTESILSALSEIHGEKSMNISNGVSSRTSYAGMKQWEPKSLEKVIAESALLKTKRNLTKSRRGRPALNDQQLLAILQDGSDPSPMLSQTSPLTMPSPALHKKQVRMRSRKAMDPEIDKQIVLKQLREFPSKKKNNKLFVERIEDVKIPKVIKTKIVSPSKEPPVPVQTSTPSRTDISSIISDWTDDEMNPPAPDASTQNNETLESNLNTTTSSVSEANISTSTNANDSLTANGEAFVKPKRVSRIIKKKIIYDPDNPETFKFASNIVQAAIASAEIKQAKAIAENKQHKAAANENKQSKTAQVDNKQIKPTTESSQPKTPGTEENKQTKSGSPESKQNKSPNESKTSTKIATKRRLTEIDKLLMDEGAVNMLYQMEQSNIEGEEAPQEQKKKKKMTSISNEKKMKLIKKSVINHSKTNLNQPVKVFRVRREKVETSNSNNISKIAVNTAARASMQSPSLSEMSAVSVNESRIIRRHSSSSFSSGCLSPRPQSPVGDVTNKSLNSTSDSGIHNKIVKRKGSRQKKASKNAADKTDNSVIAPITPVPDVAALQMKSFTQLSMEVSDNITHIIVNPTGNAEELYDYQVITELTAAVKLCTGGNAVLLSSSQGSLCGGLDLRGLLHPTVEKQRHHAEQLLDAFRELMVALCECRSALVCCVGNACTGPGVALLTLCDLALASDRATFCVAPRLRRKLPPEGAALLTRPYSLPLQIGRELVLCGRKLTASEALQRGIVSRTLWPDRFIEEVRSIVGDLMQHPSESFSIMKNILRRGEVTAVTSALRHEGRLLLDYWCSPTGQDAIREVHAHL